MYSEEVKRLVSELPNSGEIPDATHRSQVENPVCGDVTRLFFQVDQGVVADCRFQTQGCAAAIASAAAVAEMCRGRTVESCLGITVESILQKLDGLPKHKLHGAELAVEAVNTALSG